MSRPGLEIADVFRAYGPAWRRANAGHVSLTQLKVMSAIEACRTEVLGGHVAACSACGHSHVAYNSCKNRHCPKCQGPAARDWMAARAEDLLPVEYFHVVFTLPAEIARIAYWNKAAVYGLLLRASAETLRTIAADPRRLGARIGFTSVLHTWGSALTHHPHVHVVVPGGGLSPDGARWVSCRRGFFLPVRVLSRLFRRLFLEGLAALHGAGKLAFFGDRTALTDPDAFAAWLAPLRKAEWVVYAKPPFGGPEAVLAYLSRYTHRVRAAPPEGMPPGTPFGPNIHAVLACLHHSHHVGFERLARLAGELFGLTISEGAIANALHRLETPLEAERAAIRAKLRSAAVVWSDETTARINGRLHWHWVFVTPEAVLHEIAPRRARAVAEAVMGGHKPAVWISDRYAGQQEMAAAHQVCLAHVLRDVQYAIDCGDAVFAPALARLLAWTIAVGRRRDELRDSTLRQYRAKVDCRLDRLLATPAPHPAGRTLQAQVKAWRTKFFIFLEDRRVSATNNVAEREIRPSVVFRKVTGGFRSQWGPSVHAGYRSATSTARIAGQTAFDTIRGIADTLFRPVAQTA